MRHELLGLGLTARHRHQTHVMRVQERLLHAFAEDFAFSLAYPGAAARREAEMASNRAQAIWLAWSSECLRSDPDFDAIMASFLAWRMLECQGVVNRKGS